MKVTVVTLNAAEAHKAKEGLTKLKKCVSEFRKDLRHNTVELECLQSFVEGLRVVADYFEGFIKDESEEVRQDVSESRIDSKHH